MATVLEILVANVEEIRVAIVVETLVAVVLEIQVVAVANILVAEILQSSHYLSVAQAWVVVSLLESFVMIAVGDKQIQSLSSDLDLKFQAMMASVLLAYDLIFLYHQT